MSFHGVFIGIDQYESPDVNWLSSARRDAIALRSLFADTFGGNTVLLTDRDASRSAIESNLLQLASCEEDDVVVISFSGHGSPTHEIVAYDTQVDDLAGTAIQLSTLA